MLSNHPAKRSTYAQVNVSDASGLTPLLAALAGNHPELATLLLGRGAAAAGVRGPEGRGPLHWAAHHGMASGAVQGGRETWRRPAAWIMVTRL